MKKLNRKPNFQHPKTEKVFRFIRPEENKNTFRLQPLLWLKVFGKLIKYWFGPAFSLSHSDRWHLYFMKWYFMSHESRNLLVGIENIKLFQKYHLLSFLWHFSLLSDVRAGMSGTETKFARFILYSLQFDRLVRWMRFRDWQAQALVLSHRFLSQVATHVKSCDTLNFVWHSKCTAPPPQCN